jgi:type I restriction enzyme, S subunit
VSEPFAALSEVLNEARPGFACGEDLADGVFQFRMNNITTSGALDFSKKRRVPRTMPKLESFLLKSGDVLFNATNSPDLVGKSGFFPGHKEPAVFSNHFLRLRPDPAKLDGRFLARWLHLQFQRGRFRAMCRQWVNQATVNRDSLLALRLPLPPLVEQRRIADILDKAEALRAKRCAALAKLDSLTRALFLDLVANRTKQFPSAKLLAVCEDDAPITYGILQPGPNLADGVPYVRPSEIKDGEVDLSAIRRTSPAIANKYKKSVLRAGDILITIVGTIGSIATIPAELEGSNITQSSARVRVCPTKADRRYVEHFLRSDLAKRQYDQHRLGVAVERLNLHHVRDLELPLPPISLQREFARRVEAVEKLKAAQRASLAILDVLFASLQHSAFCGEL